MVGWWWSSGYVYCTTSARPPVTYPMTDTVQTEPPGMDYTPLVPTLFPTPGGQPSILPSISLGPCQLLMLLGYNNNIVDTHRGRGVQGEQKVYWVWSVHPQLWSVSWVDSITRQLAPYGPIDPYTPTTTAPLESNIHVGINDIGVQGIWIRTPVGLVPTV